MGANTKGLTETIEAYVHASGWAIGSLVFWGAVRMCGLLEQLQGVFTGIVSMP